MILTGCLFIMAFSSMAQVADTAKLIPPVTQPENEIIFEKVEQEATFPGGDRAWGSFLRNHLDPNVPVKKNAKAGYYTVIVQFIVGKDGSISDIKTLTDHGYGMEQEVIRVIKLSPKWVPARQNNRVVKAYRKQPITFVVEEDKPRKKNGN